MDAFQNQQLLSLLHEKAKQIAPDYPNIQTETNPFEHLWAITSAYEGTNLANKDMHEFAQFLISRLGWDNLKALDEWAKHHRSLGNT